MLFARLSQFSESCFVGDLDRDRADRLGRDFPVVLSEANANLIGRSPIGLGGDWVLPDPLLGLAAVFSCWILRDPSCLSLVSGMGLLIGVATDSSQL